MKTNLKDYAYFSKSQVKGIFLLAGLILSIFILSPFISKLSIAPKTNFSAFKKEISEFEKALKNTNNGNFPVTPLFDFNPNTISKETLISFGLSTSVANTFVNFRNKGFLFDKKEDLKKVYGITKADYQRLSPYIKIPKSKSTYTQKSVFKKVTKVPKQKKITPFSFNPNEANKATFLSLGLSPKVVQTILNYRKSGAKFRRKEDFQKIYGLTNKEYLTLAPFIEIPKKISTITKKTFIPKNIPQNFKGVTSIKIDINRSSIEDWKQFKGIGEITAKRIVNFRDKLGGFTSIHQLKSTYNVADSVIDKIAAQLIISPIPNKMAINTISAESLQLHPYVSRKQAYLIVNYRTNHGNYEQIGDLEKVKALSSAFIQRIAPYLNFE